MIKNKIAKLCITLALVIPSINLQPSFADEATKVKQLDKLMDYVYKTGAFNGNILIAEDGKVIYTKSFGYADFNSKRPLNSDTVFEIASNSKQFTAMAIAILKEKGLLDYQDNIEKYIPELKYKDVKIINLITHTSGLPDYMGMGLVAEHWDKSKIAVNQDVINLMAEYKPEALFTPGEKYEYSNTGYMLLATIVERSSKMSFKNFLKENIFDKIGMKNSTVYHRRMDKEKIKNYALGYVYSPEDNTFKLPDEMPEHQYVYYMDGIEGDGIVNSTVNDLLLWDQALYSEKLVKKDTLKQIFSPFVLNNKEVSNYGFGWGLQDSPEYGKIVTHNGYWPGYSSLITRYIDEHKTVIFLKNKDYNMRGFGKAVDQILHDKDFVNPIIFEKKTVAKVNTENYKDYVGRYLLDRDVYIDIFTKDNKLFTQVTGQGPIEILPEAKDMYFNNQIEFEIVFNRDKNNKVSELVLLQNGAKISSKKIN